MEKAIITGTKGFIGQNLLNEIKDKFEKSLSEISREINRNKNKKKKDKLKLFVMSNYSTQFIEESMTMPPINNIQIICEQPPNQRIVNGLVSRDIQQMLHDKGR